LTTKAHNREVTFAPRSDNSGFQASSPFPALQLSSSVSLNSKKLTSQPIHEHSSVLSGNRCNGGAQEGCGADQPVDSYAPSCSPPGSLCCGADQPVDSYAPSCSPPGSLCCGADQPVDSYASGCPSGFRSCGSDNSGLPFGLVPPLTPQGESLLCHAPERGGINNEELLSTTKSSMEQRDQTKHSPY